MKFWKDETISLSLLNMYAFSLLLTVGLLYYCCNLNVINGDTTVIKDWKTIKQSLIDAIQLLKELDDLGGLGYSKGCDSSTTIYKDYNDMVESISKKNVESIKEAIDRLKTALQKIKDTPTDQRVGIICPVTKGLTCNTDKKCECADPHSTGDPPKPFYNAIVGKCVLEEYSSCDLTWEHMHCNGELECILEQINEPASVTDRIPRSRCTKGNRDKWDLEDGQWKCSCQYNNKVKFIRIKQLHRNMTWLPSLKYKSPCNDILFKEFYINLSTANKSQEDAIKFYNSKEHKELKTELGKATVKTDCYKVKDSNYCWKQEMKNSHPLLCDTTIPLNCETSKTCLCFQSGKYNDGKAEKRSPYCSLPSGDNCSYHGYTGECSKPEHCLFTFNQAKVNCSKENLHEVMKLKLYNIPTDCKCSPEPIKNIQPYFTQKSIDLLTKESDNFRTKEILKLNKTIWEIIPNVGDKCDWKIDRMYFQMQDFIFAKLEHLYHRMAISDTVKQKGNKAEKFKVCDLKKGMRCSFLNETCGCAIDGYLSEDIYSFYNDTEGKCLLPLGSICHSNLPDWLSCQTGEQCMYKEVDVLCNRRNKKDAIEKKIRLKTAKCYCSPRKSKPTFDTVKRRKNEF